MPTFPDPKWLEILKASGGQTAALGAASGVFLLLDHWNVFGPLPSWVVPLATFGFLVCGFLALSALVAALNKSVGIQEWVLYRFEKKRAQNEIRDYIPHMTPKERQIVGYLLAKNQKVLEVDQDGGYANTLISRHVIIRYARPGRMARGTHVPMVVPDHIWQVLIRHKSEFPHQAAKPGQLEPEPWRIPWMAR